MVDFILATLTKEEQKKILIELSHNVEGIKNFAEEEQNRIQKNKEAIANYDAKLAIDPNNIKVLNKKGKSLIELTQYDKALDCYDDILKINPKKSSILRNKGELLTIMGKHREAIENLDKALENKPGNIYILEKKAKIHREIHDEDGELDCYTQMIKNDEYAPGLLNKGTILINRGEFDEAIILLDKMYGCESHDTLWAPAQLQMARASAIQEKKEDMLEYLKKAVRTTIFFEGIGTYYGKRELFRDIEQVTEFDKYRNTVEFQEFLNFEWEREDEIKLEEKVKDYLIKKQISLELIDPIRLRLVEYLCKFVERDIYLDFNLGLNWLINTSNSILIVENEMLEIKMGMRGKATYAKFNFSQDKVESIKHLDITEKTFQIEDVVYNQMNVKKALEIVGGSVDVKIPEGINPLVIKSPKSAFPYIQQSEEYRSYAKRRSYNYSVIIFPSSLHNKESLMTFLTLNGSRKFFEILTVTKKNYPENLPIESPKNLDVNKFQDINPIQGSFKILLEKIKIGINETKNNSIKLKDLLEYAQIYFSYLSEDESIIFSDFVNEIIGEMLNKGNIDDLIAKFNLPNNNLYKILNSNLKTILHQVTKTQIIKPGSKAIETHLKLDYVRKLNKAERIEIFEKINFDELRKDLSSGSIVLFDLLYIFSKFNVPTARMILNKELENNIMRLNGRTLNELTKNKYFSYMEPKQLYEICKNINFEQIFKELHFIKGVQLLERLSKMGFKSAHETIKNQALKLALNTHLNTSTKTFKKYVSDEELANYLKLHDSY